MLSDIESNIYAVHERSYIDFLTYIGIFKFEDYEYEQVMLDDIHNLQGAISTNEKLICPTKSEQFWIEQNLNIDLDTYCSFDKKIHIKGKRISNNDKVIDCTWGHLIPNKQFFHQDFISFLLVRKSFQHSFDALTVMDGDFYSIYPYSSNTELYTITHVQLGVIKKDDISDNEAYQIFKNNT